MIAKPSLSSGIRGNIPTPNKNSKMTDSLINILGRTFKDATDTQQKTLKECFELLSKFKPGNRSLPTPGVINDLKAYSKTINSNPNASPGQKTIIKFLDKLTSALECESNGNSKGAENNMLEALKQIPELASITLKEDKEVAAKQLADILAKTVPPFKGGHKPSFIWFFGAITVMICLFTVPGVGPLTGTYALGKISEAIQSK